MKKISLIKRLTTNKRLNWRLKLYSLTLTVSKNEAIKAVNKNWSLADENISTKLSVIVNGESKTQAILAEKIKLTETANINQQEQVIKAQQLDTEIQKNQSELDDAINNKTTGTIVLQEKLTQLKQS